MSPLIRILLSACLAAVLCHCGTPSPPQCRVLPRDSRGDPALILDDARASWQALAVADSPAARAAARERYNASLAKLIDQMRCGVKGTGDLAARAAAMGTTIDTTRTLGTGLRLEDLDAVIPSSVIDLDRIGERHTDPGIGVPLVGWKKTAEEGKPRFDFAPPTGLPLNLTAILDFSPAVPTWRLVFPGRVEGFRVGSREEPVAADWSAPGAFYWQMSDLDDLDLAKVFLPSRFKEETRLYLATPYSPDRIPVIFVHGLKSSPGTYKTMYNDLIGEKWFREKYQVWFFSYPTGTSWVINASEFRSEIRRATEYARARGPLTQWDRMVLVGHSMGGVISHASLVDPGTRLYDHSFDGPIDRLPVAATTREAIREVTLYKPLAEPERVIFMAAPHQGSPLADRFFSQWASNLIRLPKTLTINLLDVTMTELAGVLKDGGSPHLLQTSIGTLSPTFNGYQALTDSPWRPDLKKHSIIGDRGLGDTPESSDGIVPYWSSHIEPVLSETIVPAGHSLCGDAATIAEVKRILELHLRETR